jgi:hypothetical protein
MAHELLSKNLNLFSVLAPVPTMRTYAQLPGLDPAIPGVVAADTPLEGLRLALFFSRTMPVSRVLTSRGSCPWRAAKSIRAAHRTRPDPQTKLNSAREEQRFARRKPDPIDLQILRQTPQKRNKTVICPPLW